MNPVTLRLDAPGLAHPYHLEAGLLGSLGAFLRSDGHGRCVIVTDENVAQAWRPVLDGGLGDLRREWIVLPAGEEQKTLDRARDLYSRLLELEVDRRTPVLAFGGGVVGDLAGFAAATLLRGLPLYQVPTTLLAMVDSSIGGKTGVDLPEGKNLVGAFYAPRAVLVDPAVLSTLPMREWAGGMSEVIKHALIASRDLFELVEELSEDAAPDLWSSQQLHDLVEGAARVKLDIVGRDPFEKGDRAWLNLGHTLGHALEAAGDYGLQTHGEAVAVGMLAALRLSRRLGLLEEDFEHWLVMLYHAWDLPRFVPASLEWPRVAAAMRRDKKRVEGKHTFVLPRRVGEVTVVPDVPEDEVQAVFEALLAGGRGPGFG